MPGLIDNHNHIVLLGLRPGHDTRLENADSIEAVLATIAAKAAALPGGEWITSIGGFDINQFIAAARRAALSDARGARFRPPESSRVPPAIVLRPVGHEQPRQGVLRASRSIEVGADGSLAGGFQTPNPTTRALHALRQLQTLEDQKRGTRDAMRYAASVGITTHLDEGGFPATGTDTDGAAHFDEYRAYDALLALYQPRRAHESDSLELPAHGGRPRARRI